MKTEDHSAPDGIYVVNANPPHKDQTLPHSGVKQSDIDVQNGRKSKQHRQWIAAIISTCTLFMMGMSLGWSSPVIKKLKSSDSKVKLTDEQISWMISLLYIGSISSPLPTGFIMDRFGRKAALYFTSLESLLTWVLMLVTDTPSGIYVARFFAGSVGGSGYTIVPIYLSEIAEPKVRGALNSIFTLMTYNGIMYEYLIGPYVSYNTLNFFSLLVPIVVMALLYYVPESPYFYAMKENREAALNSLAWLRCADKTTDVVNEYNVIEKNVTEMMKNKKGISDLIRSAGNRKALLMTEALAVLQRMSGISVIMAYAASAAPSSWILNADQCAVLICLTWIIFGFWSTGLVDRLGRRVLTVISCAGCGVAMFSYGLFDYVRVHSDLNSASYDWVSFAALLLYSVFFPVGLGCVPNIVQGEVFPSNVKGVASGLTSVIIALTSFITNKLYQPIGANFGLYTNYWIFAVSCAFGVLFGAFILIETKGKTLQEIQIELSEIHKNGKMQDNTKTETDIKNMNC